MSVYLSSGAFLTRALGEVLDACRERGVARLELSSGLLPAGDLSALEPHLGHIEFLVHNYFPAPAEPFVLNLASANPETLARSKAHCQRAIELAARLGAPFYSVHSGFAFELTPEVLGDPLAQRDLERSSEVPYSVAYATFLEAVSALAEHAGRHGLDLLIENNVAAPAFLEGRDTNPLLMCGPHELTQFFSDLEAPNVGLLFDTGHAKVSGTAIGFNPAEFLLAVGENVRGFHLSENDGQRDQNLPFDETAWFAPRLREFAEVPCVIEAYRLEASVAQAQVDLTTDLRRG